MVPCSTRVCGEENCTAVSHLRLLRALGAPIMERDRVPPAPHTVMHVGASRSCDQSRAPPPALHMGLAHPSRDSPLEANVREHLRPGGARPMGGRPPRCRLLHMLKLSLESFDLEDILNESVLLVQHMARQKPDVALRLRLDVGDSPRELLGPVNLLKQVIINLLTNAIKYTAAGHILLRASLAGPGDEQLPPILISVEDTGCGIPANKLTTIFKPFEQGYKPGTGLGLPLCNDMLCAMGSKLSVSQPPSGGSIFSFVLKCRVAPAPAPQAASSLPECASAGPPMMAAVASSAGSSDQPSIPRGDALRVLVADDLRMNRMFLIKKLKPLLPHMLVTEAADGEGALSALSRARADAPFDIAFLDEHYSLDGLKGTDVTRRYREIEARHPADNGGTQRLVIVGCSGSAGVDRHDEAACAAGQDFVLGKPMPTAQQVVKLLEAVRPSLFRPDRIKAIE